MGGKIADSPANGRGNWQHNPQHRSNAAYKDRATADRFGGSARGDSLSSRQAGARQQISRQGGSLANSRAGNLTGPNGSAPRIGSGDLSRSAATGNRDSFGGGTRGFEGASARSGASRDMKSISRAGGGGLKGGGFKGGFSRGGGGGRVGGGGRR